MQASAYGTNPAAAAYNAYASPAVSAPAAYNPTAQKYTAAYGQPPVSAPAMPDTSAQMASVSAAPAAMPPAAASSQIPPLAAQMPGAFGAPGMPSLGYNAPYGMPYNQFPTPPNPQSVYAMYGGAAGMAYPGFNSAMPPYPQVGEVRGEG
eukprot:1156352-Pelagomonas_calceolata.AAC.8